MPKNFSKEDSSKRFDEIDFNFKNIPEESETLFFFKKENIYPEFKINLRVIIFLESFSHFAKNTILLVELLKFLSLDIIRTMLIQI